MRLGMRRRDNWAERVVRVQVALSSAGERVEPPSEEDGWPARLIHAGTALLGVSGALLAGCLRRHLQQ